MSTVVSPILRPSRDSALIVSRVVNSETTRKKDHRRLTESRVMELLESHPHFRGRGHWLKCRCLERCLYLKGKLPSYFLKQLAQETVRNVVGVDRIENQIEVINPYGYDLIDPELRPQRKPR